MRLVNRDGWEYVERTTAGHPVAILAVVDDAVVLVEQFRVPLQQRAIELPAGLMDWGEDYRKTAIRELEEETGYRASEINLLHFGQVSSGLTTERIYIVEATGLEKVSDGGGVAAENERIMVRHVPLADIPKCFNYMCYKDVAVDPKLFAALYFYYQKRGRIAY